METVAIKSPARLHFGLFNTSGAFGRINGGAGMAIESPSWQLTITGSNRDNRIYGLAGEHLSSARNLLDSVSEETGEIFCLHIHERIEPHVGLGAKTSLLMAVAEGIRLLGVPLAASTRQLGKRVGRGGTSGIGVQTSTAGGIAVDFGHSLDEGGGYSPSSRATRIPAPGIGGIIPAELGVVHFRFDDAGPFGDREQAIFNNGCPTSEQSTLELFAAWYGLTLPALLAGHDSAIQDGIRRMQGIGFKRVEWNAQGNRTLEFRSYFQDTCPDIALGLSSMGPTMFCLTNRTGQVLDSIHDYGSPPFHLEVTHMAAAGARAVGQKGSRS